MYGNRREILVVSCICLWCSSSWKFIKLCQCCQR